MKKLFISIGFLLSLFTVVGQPITPRGSTTNTVADQRLQATLNFFTPRYADTTAANASIGIDSCGAVIFTYDAMSLWQRKCSPKHWALIGGTVTTSNSPSITFSGDGSPPNPLIAAVNLSTANGNALQLNPDGLFSPLFIQDGLKLGGNISNVGGIYTYDVQTAFYVINSQPYTAPTTQVTLANADPTFNRIDRIVATTSNTIVVIQGTAAANPQEPSYDPTTQLPLGIVLVTAGSTGPTVTNEQIYINNTEWTTSSSTVRINPASAVNPFSAPLDVQFTAAQNGDFITFTDPSPPTTLTNFKILTLKIISDAAWAASSRLILQWKNGVTNVGLPVSIFDGTLFSSTQTSTYQTFTAAITAFAPTSTVTSFVITVSTTGANTISAKIDDIVLQGGDGAIVPVQGTFHQQGGNRYASTFVVGSQDNFNTNVIANNTTIATFQTGGTIWMPQTNPGISLFLGTFAAADYYIQRIANTTTLNVASGAIISHTIAGVSVNSMSAANGHLFNSTAGSFQMQLNSSGQLLVGTNSATASNLAAFNSTTRAVRLTNQTTAQMNAIANDAGMITYNTTAGSLYYNDGSGWFPIGGAITANNGLTMSTASNAQLGGTLIQTTTINSGGFAMVLTGTAATSLAVTNTLAGGQGISITSVGQGFTVTSSAAAAIVASSTTNTAITGAAAAASTYGVAATGNYASTNTIAPTLLLQRNTTGTAAAGIGTAISFQNEFSNGTIAEANQVISKLTDVTAGAYTSQLQVTAYNSGVSGTIATFDGSGVVGIGVTSSFAATRLDVRDNSIASGSMVSFSSTSSSFNAAQGRLVSIAFSGVNVSSSMITEGMRVTNSRTGAGTVTNRGIYVAATGGTINYGLYADNGTSSGAGVYARGAIGVTGEGTTSGGAGGEFFNDAGGEGLRASASGGVPVTVSNATATTNTSVDMIDYSINSTGTSANGFGMRFEYNISTATSNADAMVETMTWTNATHASRTSQYLMQLFNSGVQGTVLTIAGNGQLTVGSAYQGLGTGYLSVNNSGVVSWSAGSGGGGGDVVKVGTPVNNQLGVWTGNGTIEGDANLTFTGSTLTVGVAGSTTGVLQLTGLTSGTISIRGASAAGTYTLTLPTDDGTPNQFLQTDGSGNLLWATPGGVGTVTSVGISGSDFVISGSPVTSSGTIALTLATVNSNVGTFGNSSAIPIITVNAKGLVTAVSTTTIVAPAGSLSGTTLNATVVSSSLTSVGNLTAGSITTGFTIGDVTMNLAGTDASGDMYYRNASGVLTRLPIGPSNSVLTSNSGIPVWQSLGSGGTVTQVTLTEPSQGGFTITNSGVPQTTVASFTFSLTGDLAGLEALATLGIVRRTSANVYTAGTLVSLTSEVSGILPVANGGTNINSITSSRVLVTNATGYSQVLPTFGNGVTVTVGAGTLDIRGVFNPTPQTLTDAATIVWNVTNGGNAFINLLGTGRTLQIQNAVAGYTYTIRIQQGSASRTITTWPTGTRWAGGTVPTLSTTSGAIDIVSLYFDGTNFYGTFGAAFSMIDIPMIEEGKVIPLYFDDIKREDEIEIAA